MDCDPSVMHCTGHTMDGSGNAIFKAFPHCQARPDQSTCAPSEPPPRPGRANMTRAADRRRFIKTVVASAAAASVARLYPAAAADSGAVPPQKLSDNLWLLVSGG